MDGLLYTAFSFIKYSLADIGPCGGPAALPAVMATTAKETCAQPSHPCLAGSVRSLTCHATDLSALRRGAQYEFLAKPMEYPSTVDLRCGPFTGFSTHSRLVGIPFLEYGIPPY